MEVRGYVLTLAGQKRAPAPLCQAPSAPAPRTRAVQARSYRIKTRKHENSADLTVDWTMVKVVDLDERDTRSSLQLSSSDRTCLVCDGASDEAARKVDQQRSQSLGISKHTELAAFFYFGKSDAEQVGSREHFSIK